MAPALLTAFVGGQEGPWRVERIDKVIGPTLPKVDRLQIVSGNDRGLGRSLWVLRGVTSNMRYTERDEANELSARQEGLGRPQSSMAALIPIRKSEAWWELAQDERRAVFEEQSRHIGIGLEFLPAIARRLHHCRELGEPFDFLTWFEYAPEDAQRFEDLVGRLRSTPEWRFVDHEVDIRLSR
jgi:chlorite dismutase